MRAIFADNLQKKFGEKTVLDGVSFDVSEGKIFGLLGPSGAGKNNAYQYHYRSAFAERRICRNSGDRYPKNGRRAAL